MVHVSCTIIHQHVVLPNRRLGKVASRQLNDAVFLLLEVEDANGMIAAYTMKEASNINVFVRLFIPMVHSG